ncbi:aldehyde dehydrogenase family protein, partial [Acinetobacter baumannii]
RVTDALLARVNTASVGNGFADGIDLGPLSTKPQFDRVCALTEGARDAGARLRGKAAVPEGSGYFLPPRLVTGVDDAAPLVAEEQFGPSLPILP